MKTLIRKVLKLFRGDSGKWICGRYQGTRNGKVCYCLDGAAREVLSRDGLHKYSIKNTEVRERFAQALGFHTAVEMQAWNDKPSRRFSHVQKRLKKALDSCQK